MKTDLIIKSFDEFKEGVKEVEDMVRLHQYHALAKSDPVYLRITKETAYKREIRDIQDELNIINDLLMDQTTAIDKFKDIAGTRLGGEHSSWVGEVSEVMDTHKADVTRMQSQARRTHDMVCFLPLNIPSLANCL